MKTKHRILSLEHLQRRDLFAADSLAWGKASALRLSFAPDGTQVGDQVSNLNAVLSQSPAGAAWRDSIVKAFQIWSQYAAINVGVVSDSGLPIGTQGATSGDDRFGDIRIAGLPMTNDTWAAAIAHTKTSSGSWAGDMFFNTQANWNQHPDDLLRVALHEAGHVLGLPHSSNPNSPMHEHGVPTSLTPTANDIALLQEAYGVRGLDANEVAKPNDTLGNATRMRFSDVASSFDGSKPLIHYGEISQASDRDIFYFEVPQTYHDTTTVHVESRGLSQLQFRLTVKDNNGNTLQTGDNLAVQGGEVHLSIPGTSNGGKYYLQIDAIGDPINRVGSYAVIAELNGRVSVPYATTLKSVQTASRWFLSSPTVLGSVDVGTLAISPKNGTLVDDKGNNDSFLDATRIDPFLDNPQQRSARTIGTISSAKDVDYYRFRAPRPPEGKSVGLLVQLDDIERNGLLPEIEVRDDAGKVVPTRYLVNGNSEVKLWVEDVTPNKDYTVRVRGVTGSHNIGNYELTATFQELKPTTPLLAQSQLTDSDPTDESILYVARPQLFTLALESISSSIQVSSVWARIIDSEMNVLFTLAGPANQLRTGSSVLLMPGTYYLQSGAKSSASETPQSLSVRVLGSADSDPLGPAPVDPASTPIFGCPDSPDIFCYPPDIQSLVPFELLPDPPFEMPNFSELPPELIPDDTFFPTAVQRTDSTPIPLDANNDGFITALDALVIINQINSYGTGSVAAQAASSNMDSNQDGFITSLDALMVINRLNNTAAGEGENSSPLDGPVDEFNASDLFDWQGKVKLRRL